MKTIKEHAGDLRAMASMLTEAADALEGFHDTQLRGVLGALGLALPDQPAAPPPQSEPLVPVPIRIRKEYAELPPAQRTLESRIYLARKYSKSETEVSHILEGPVLNGSLTRK